jgi:hypothetical protein
VQAYSVAIVGLAAFSGAVVFLRVSKFGTRQRFDTLLRFRAGSAIEIDQQVQSVLDKHCHDVSLIDVRAAGSFEQEFAYHLTLSRAGSEVAIIRELEGVNGVSDATIFKQDATLEM